MDRSVTVFALFYGDYPQLAARCIDSLVATLPPEIEIRIGTNAISPATKQALMAHWPRRLYGRNWYESPENLNKYPMMRRLFHDPDNPVTTDWTMWFDDDSFLQPAAYLGRGRQVEWIDELLAFLQTTQSDMVGSIYHMGLRPKQREWTKAQAWYTEKPFGAKYSVRFATGGWWCIRTELLKRYNWPIPELDHNGGDVALGELLRQQGLKLSHFSSCLAINADDQGRESKAARRGTNQLPIGATYVAPPKTSKDKPPAKPSIDYANLDFS